MTGRLAVVMVIMMIMVVVLDMDVVLDMAVVVVMVVWWLGKGSKNQNGLKWILPLGVGPPPLPLMEQISSHFLANFFLLQLNPTYMKLIVHLVSVKNIDFRPSYNWFKY